MKLGLTSCQCLMLCFIGLALGCGNDQVAESFREMNKLNMQKLANSYVMFASVNGNVGPKDASELKNFIATDERVPPRLGMTSSDLDDLDSIFVSDADGEPFKIRFGLEIRMDEDHSPLVFDAVGVDGMRRVALADNKVLEVSDEERYERLWNGDLSDSESGMDESEMDGDLDAD